LNEEIHTVENPVAAVSVTPEIRHSRRWNAVWFVPVVALLLGIWLLYRNFATQGPVAIVRFETAGGISPAKTEVRCRSVRVGIVKHVKLAEDLDSVEVRLEFDKEAEGLLRRGTRFWVVKPRISAGDLTVSGVDTLITGAYIEMEPGPAGGPQVNHFQGYETPPTTSRNVPGLHVTLTADEAGFLSLGSPVYHRGFEVGRIEGRSLSQDGTVVTYSAFINKEFQHLVTSATRFWNTSGIDISAGSDGFKVRTPSFQAMVAGGVCFGNSPTEKPGDPIKADATFPLFPDQDAALKASFRPTFKSVLLFDQSVRGLAMGAPVEFRGIAIGRVADISFDLMPSSLDPRIPVLIEIDPSLMRPDVAKEVSGDDLAFIKQAVGNGLRGGLKTSSLITGAMYVDLDYYKDTPRAELGKAGEFITVPTVSTGLAQLEAKVTAILDKIQSVPIDKTMGDIAAAAAEAKTTIADARNTLKEIEATSAAARKILEDPEFRSLPADLRKTLSKVETLAGSVGPDGAVQGDLLRTLDELRAALRSIKSATTTIDEKPNSLLFGRDTSGNPKPKAPHGGR
jgi:paraquat-inducible protein B